MILGIDIGGANTKAASSDGRFTASTYLPLWMGCDLEGALKEIRQKAGAVECVGVTITGELADCYASKKEGVGHISEQVKKVFPGALFYGCDGTFHEDVHDHSLFSAANWSASARFIGTAHKNVIMIDVGSTTSDIIPIVDGIPRAGLTDLERLGRGELIYAGALRTNLAALLHTVTLRGNAVRTASELFAITADVNLILGHIAGEDYTCDAPDGGKKTPDASALRLARVVCCDREELSMDEILDLARQAYGRQLQDLEAGISEVSAKNGLTKAIILGLGDFIARDALVDLAMPFTMAAETYGKQVSRVFPAYAVARSLLKKG